MCERHLVCTPQKLTIIFWKLQMEADCCAILDNFQHLSSSAPVWKVAESHSLPALLWSHFNLYESPFNEKIGFKPLNDQSHVAQKCYIFSNLLAQILTEIMDFSNFNNF